MKVVLHEIGIVNQPLQHRGQTWRETRRLVTSRGAVYSSVTQAKKRAFQRHAGIGKCTSVSLLPSMTQ